MPVMVVVARRRFLRYLGAAVGAAALPLLMAPKPKHGHARVTWARLEAPTAGGAGGGSASVAAVSAAGDALMPAGGYVVAVEF